MPVMMMPLPLNNREISLLEIQEAIYTLSKVPLKNLLTWTKLLQERLWSKSVSP